MTDAELIEKLSDDESRRLRKCEQLIADSQLSFVQLGEALREIRDSRYYRVGFTTFESYCRERWGISRVHAHRSIEAAGVLGNLLPIGNTAPTTESQCRPLTVLKPEQQKQAWCKAIELAGDKQPTAKVVVRAVEEVTSAVTEMERNKIVATLSVEEDMTTEDVAKLTGCTEAQVSRVRDEMAEESRETMTFPEAIAKASRRKSITAEQLNAWLGKSQKTAEMRKWLSLSKQVTEFAVIANDDGGQRITRRPSDDESIIEAFSQMSPQKKVALLAKLNTDPEVLRIRSAKQQKQVRQGDNATVWQAASSAVRESEDKLHIYEKHYSHDYRWLRPALNSDEGTEEMLLMVSRLSNMSVRAKQLSDALNERTSDV